MDLVLNREVELHADLPFITALGFDAEPCDVLVVACFEADAGLTELH